MIPSPARSLRWAFSLLAAALCLLVSAGARADWLSDLTGRGTLRFCPLVYGPACKVSLHLDVAVDYERSWLEETSKEYVRVSGELGVLGRIGNSHVHVGAEVEAGAQIDDPRALFHAAPRLKLRYFPARGPVTLELGSGPMYERKFIAQPGANWLGVSSELSVGVLGFVSVVGGVDALRSVDGAPGTEVHLFVGGRLSIVSVIYVLLQKR